MLKLLIMKSFFLTPEQYSDLKGRYAKFNEPWTADEAEELRQMAADGVTRAEMAAQLGRSPGAIKMKLQSLGLYVPKPAAKPKPAAAKKPAPTSAADLYAKPAKKRTPRKKAAESEEAPVEAAPAEPATVVAEAGKEDGTDAE